MSVFLPNISGSGNLDIQSQAVSNLTGPELHLSCLKSVALQVQSPTAQGSSSKTIARIWCVVAVVLLTYILA